MPPWNQALPADPTAGSWQPLILESTDLFHAPPPPANSSAQTMHEHDMEEIVAALNNRTCYTDFISFKWANEQPGRWPAEIMDGLMSRYDWDAPTTARAEAILYAAMYDSLLTTWHEKFRYLRPRPALLESALPTVILTPKHPSYPAGTEPVSPRLLPCSKNSFLMSVRNMNISFPKLTTHGCGRVSTSATTCLPATLSESRLPMRLWRKCI
ncbi:MAG: hypothetical protein WCB11_25785 [Terriglobales bacterium]